MPVVELMPVGSGQAERLRLAVDIGERSARPDIHALGGRIDPDPAHWRQIDQQAAIAYGAAGDVVATATHRNEKLMLPRQVHGEHNVGRALAPDGKPRPAIDHCIPDRPRLVIAGIGRRACRAAQGGPERLKVLGRDGDRHCADCGNAEVCHFK